MTKPSLQWIFPFVHSFAVWPFIFGYLIFWGIFMVYSPAEVTELQRVPRILQGGTDWGGSNIFAGYVAGHFLFGLVGCFLLTRIRISPENSKPLKRVLFGFIPAFILGSWGWLTHFVEASLGNHNADQINSNYFVCDYIQIFVLFAAAYSLSAAWILFVCKRPVPPWAKYTVSPLFILLLAVAGSAGITPKSGKVLNAYVVPDYHANSYPHELLLSIHKRCTRCTTGW